MNEIEKMYENAGVKIQNCLCSYRCVFDKSNKNCIVNEKCKTKDCAYLDDNSFTAEKQLELIKWLAINNNIDYCKYYHQEIKNVWVFVCVTLTE